MWSPSVLQKHLFIPWEGFTVLQVDRQALNCSLLRSWHYTAQEALSFLQGQCFTPWKANH